MFIIKENMMLVFYYLLFVFEVNSNQLPFFPRKIGSNFFTLLSFSLNTADSTSRQTS